MTIETAIQFLGILGAGALVGIEFTVSAFINPTLHQLDTTAYVSATKRLAAILGRVMPVWYALVFLSAIGMSICAGSKSPVSLVLSTVAALIWFIAILASILFLVPINNQIAKWDVNSFTEEDRQNHLKWDYRHRYRVIAVTVAFALMILGALLRSQ